MSSLLEISRMGLQPLIIVAVKSLLETRIGLDPLIIVDVKSLLESRIGSFDEYEM